jgi:hypothetical protein
VQGTVCKIPDEQEVKPHKVRYYLERRDPEFKAKIGARSVRLPRGKDHQGDCGRSEAKAKRCNGDRFL